MKRRENPGNRLLTRAEVAKLFQVSPSTITRWAEAGKLPVIKTLGGHRRYEASAVTKLAQDLKNTLTSAEVAKTKKETSMEKSIINVPAMYGDHHVLEVRRLIYEIPGVEDVNASSCFQTVEVTYNPAKISIDEITGKLDEAGYLEALTIPSETGTAVTQRAEQDDGTFFRHTTAYEQAKDVVSFAQDVQQAGRALWPCPGVGVIKGKELEKEAIHG